MKFSIITPSKNQASWLETCIASVSDQVSESIEVEHIIEDCKSSDNTKNLLNSYSSNFSDNKNYTIKYKSKKDLGMYDALNKGLEVATGDIFAYLNCDEQYLPNSLRKVKKFFDTNKNIDAIYSDILILNNNGECLSFKKMINFDYYKILYHTPPPSCGWFIRKKSLDEKNIRFDHNYKIIGDKVFFLEMMSKGLTVKAFPFFLSTFTITGNNLGKSSKFEEEKVSFESNFSKLITFLKPFVLLKSFVKKLFLGKFFINLKKYSIYKKDRISKGRFTFSTKSARAFFRF